MNYIRLSKLIAKQSRAVQKFHEERWRRGFGCIRCGSIKCWKHGKLKNGLNKYRCKDCGRVFSDQSGTALAWMKSKLESWLIVWEESYFKATCRDTAKKAGIDKDTAWRLLMNCRKLKSQLVEAPLSLKGKIEIDETKLNGKWYLGLIERKTQRTLIVELNDRSEDEICGYVWRKVDNEESIIYHDGFSSYNPLLDWGYAHYMVNHSKHFVDPQNPSVHTNTIEGLWKHLKRKINALHIGVSDRFRKLYIDEFLYQKNYKPAQNPSFFPLSSAILNSTPPHLGT